MNLQHVMLLEIEVTLSREIPPVRKVVLYNKNRVNDEEAMRIVNSGEYNPNVLCIPKAQWEALFRNKEV